MSQNWTHNFDRKPYVYEYPLSLSNFNFYVISLHGRLNSFFHNEKPDQQNLQKYNGDTPFYAIKPKSQKTDFFFSLVG